MNSPHLRLQAHSRAGGGDPEFTWHDFALAMYCDLLRLFTKLKILPLSGLYGKGAPHSCSHLGC